jgi:hypothetical protein
LLIDNHTKQYRVAIRANGAARAFARSGLSTDGGSTRIDPCQPLQRKSAPKPKMNNRRRPEAVADAKPRACPSRPRRARAMRTAARSGVRDV